jgi:U3 small nucleolar RNA-associated protein 7
MKKKTKEERHLEIESNRKGINQYLRSTVATRSIPQKTKNKKLHSLLKKTSDVQTSVALSALDQELLFSTTKGTLTPSTPLEKTWKLSSKDLSQLVDVNTQKKVLDLDLEFGPYRVCYTKNGRHMLFTGSQGHISSINVHSLVAQCEFHVKEHIRDMVYLHDETLFAVAQKKYVYMYDNQGTEVHVLKEHIDVNRLCFLPFHFLLGSIGNAGWLKYQDVSTGEMVSRHRSGLGRCNAMTVNKQNGVVVCGHAGGSITMWSPAMQMPLVKIQAHGGMVSDVSVDRSGRYLCSVGQGEMKVWDIRMYKQMDSYFIQGGVGSMGGVVEWSDAGCVAVTGGNGRVSVWKDIEKSKQKEIYMSVSPDNHNGGNSNGKRGVCDVKFRPYEDILAIGHAGGFCTRIVPGCGEPNFDTFADNPYENRKQRGERGVRMLLDKLDPGMIGLGEFGNTGSGVGSFDTSVSSLRVPPLLQQKPIQQAVEDDEEDVDGDRVDQKAKVGKVKRRMRGKSSSQRRYLKKHANVVEEVRRGKVVANGSLPGTKEGKSGGVDEEKVEKSALDRFGHS